MPASLGAGADGSSQLFDNPELPNGRRSIHAELEVGSSGRFVPRGRPTSPTSLLQSVERGEACLAGHTRSSNDNRTGQNNVETPNQLQEVSMNQEQPMPWRAEPLAGGCCCPCSSITENSTHKEFRSKPATRTYSCCYWKRQSARWRELQWRPEWGLWVMECIRNPPQLKQILLCDWPSSQSKRPDGAKLRIPQWIFRSGRYPGGNAGRHETENIRAGRQRPFCSS